MRSRWHRVHNDDGPGGSSGEWQSTKLDVLPTLYDDGGFSAHDARRRLKLIIDIEAASSRRVLAQNKVANISQHKRPALRRSGADAWLIQNR